MVRKIKGGIILIPQAEPVSPVTGQIYFNQNSSALYLYTGSAWEEISNG